MEKINKELESLSPEEQKRIKNLECEASRYLWYPDHESSKNIRVYVCGCETCSAGAASHAISILSMLLSSI